MELKNIKGTGYGLLILGLLFIFYSVYSMYNVFTGAEAAPSVIQMNSVKISLPTGPGTPPMDTELISGKESSIMTNMGLWFMLMTFVASAGGRIGGLGVKLVRDIKIEVKNED
ncbi:MAG: hypothetical protein FIB07_10335 [Candidatus Methanoperedens sp.]|nr:hypothetical protein [Candidatus Methanoperedens sp.]